MHPAHEPGGTPAVPSAAVIIRFPVPDSDFGLVAALRSSHPDANLVLCERYAGELLAIATRILGPLNTIPLLVVEVLRQALARIEEPFETRQFRQWLLSLLMSEIRRRWRARRRWGWFARHSVRHWSKAVRYGKLHVAAYRILDRMPEDQRLIFCLVMIHSLGLVEAAKLLNFSLEQAERALDQAQASFLRHSRRIFRNQEPRRLQLLSVGAAIVLEQDLVLEDWWLTEYDLLEAPKREQRRPFLLVVALLRLLFLWASNLDRRIRSFPESKRSDRATRCSVPDRHCSPSGSLESGIR
jgi:DNA-directed RNA polymerase specialized sigma24 family protein